MGIEHFDSLEMMDFGLDLFNDNNQAKLPEATDSIDAKITPYSADLYMYGSASGEDIPGQE